MGVDLDIFLVGRSACLVIQSMRVAFATGGGGSHREAIAVRSLRTKSKQSPQKPRLQRVRPVDGRRRSPIAARWHRFDDGWPRGQKRPRATRPVAEAVSHRGCRAVGAPSTCQECARSPTRCLRRTPENSRRRPVVRRLPQTACRGARSCARTRSRAGIHDEDRAKTEAIKTTLSMPSARIQFEIDPSASRRSSSESAAPRRPDRRGVARPHEFYEARAAPDATLIGATGSRSRRRGRLARRLRANAGPPRSTDAPPRSVATSGGSRDGWGATRWCRLYERARGSNSRRTPRRVPGSTGGSLQPPGHRRCLTYLRRSINRRRAGPLSLQLFRACGEDRRYATPRHSYLEVVEAMWSDSS